MRVRLETPPRFDFRRTVLSHGWGHLAPLRLATDAARLEAVVDLPGSTPVPIRLEPGVGHVVLRAPGRTSAVARAALIRAARRMLSLDVDLAPFWDRVADDPRYRWMAGTGAGRMLRAPSTWEDLVKLVLTTNCAWASTVRMTGTLVARWGRPTADGRRAAFPDAGTLAGVGERSLRAEARVGYRAPFLIALARAVADGTIRPDAWETDARPAAELRRDLLRLPGVGPYVAENLLKFLGRPSGLALDSWMRAEYSRIHHGGRAVTDRTIERRHAKLGDWAGLALWIELTRDWYEAGDPSEVWAGNG